MHKQCHIINFRSLHKNFQENHLNSRRFPGFPGGFSNSKRFPGFPGVVDTLTLAMNSTVAETGDKSATNLTVADMVNFVAGFGTNRQQLEFASLLRLTTRSTLSQIRSTLTPVCTGLTKLTVLNSTLSPACTGLIQYSESHTWGRLTYHKMKCIQATINNYHLQCWGLFSCVTSTK